MCGIVEAISFLILLSVVALRPLVSETYDTAGDAISQALGGLADPTPVRTLAFDLLILVSALGWLIARAIGPVRRFRPTGLEWGAALVFVGAVASCVVAGQRRLAITAAVDWLCYPILTIALVQLMRQPWQRRLLIASILATATAQAVQCIDQYHRGFADTYAQYESIKRDLWARQGVALDAPKVALFEGRLQAREASGFFAHSNVAASHLLLCGFAAIGLVITRLRRTSRAAPGGPVATLAGNALGALLVYALILTGSLAAMVSGVCGVVLWLALRLGRRSVRRNPTRALTIGWLVILGGAGAVVGYGVNHDALPGTSLTFRWQYWKASSALIADHPLTGVGRENFGRHYLRYKAIESPEEVANPHNPFVQAAADWGALGLIGVVAMMFGASRRLAAGAIAPGSAAPPKNPMAPSRNAAPTNETTRPIKRATLVGGAVALALAVNVARLALVGTIDANYLYYSGVVTTLSWGIGMAAFLPLRGIRPSPRAPELGGTAFGASVGLFAFLLADMIGFALFVPATATTFFAVLAFCLADRDGIHELSPPSRDHGGALSRQSRDREGAVLRSEDSGPRDGVESTRANPLADATSCDDASTRMRRRVPVAVAAIAVAVVGIGAVQPAVRSTTLLDRARRASAAPITGPIDAHPADRLFREAAIADPLDGTASADRAAWLLGVAMTMNNTDRRIAVLRRAVPSLDEAIRRDPYNVRLRRIHAQVYGALADASGDPGDDRAAVRAAEEALALYPLDPDGLIALARSQEAAARRANSSPMRDRAAASYRRALELDDRRLKWETIRRWTPERRAEIEQEILRLGEESNRRGL